MGEAIVGKHVILTVPVLIVPPTPTVGDFLTTLQAAFRMPWSVEAMHKQPIFSLVNIVLVPTNAQDKVNVYRSNQGQNASQRVIRTAQTALVVANVTQRVTQTVLVFVSCQEMLASTEPVARLKTAVRQIWSVRTFEIE